MSKTICRQAAGIVAAIFFAASAAHGSNTPAKFLGANSCASTSCHGRGGTKQNEFLVWSLKDFHSQRPTATLSTARSKQIADALEIKDPTADARCTTCHSPLHDVPENLRGENFKVSDGVSCESCHGPAEKWLRAHTRTDYTRADRTAAGMRDLQNLYIRANTCVACHQVVSQPLLKAGHPELIFELDGQSVAEPKHWGAEKNGNGAQAWFVGQAAALREMEWQVVNGQEMDEKFRARTEALFWLLQKVSAVDSSYPAPSFLNTKFMPATVQKWADDLARAAAEKWPAGHSRKVLEILADTKDNFQNDSGALLARRAERLVLALDRLVAALPELKGNEPVQTSLNQLFKLAQSIPDFDPKQFAEELQKLADALKAH